MDIEPDEITAFAEVGTLLVTLIGLIVAGRQFYRQNRLSFYSKYTERCSTIMKEIPKSVLFEEKEIGTFYESEEFMNVVFRYFDLCSEEYYLAQSGYLEEKVWSDWKDGMQAMFNKPSINHQLQMIKDKFADAYPDFIDFLKYELQIKNL